MQLHGLETLYFAYSFSVSGVDEISSSGSSVN